MASISLVPGQVFAGDFLIERELAEGGMGVVYVAMQQSTGKRRALKVMQPQLLSSKNPGQTQKNQERFMAEARVGGAIESEHVVEVAVAGIDASTGAPWLAMEFLEGSTLKDELSLRGRFSPSEVSVMYEQLCHALSAAHRAGVFHLDLKPENIFLSRSKNARGGTNIKVLDFGIAKLVSEHRQSATMTTAMGSPFWMSPEQAQRGARVGAYSDVWALGLIAFQLLTGKHYWREANVAGEQISVTSWLMEMMTEALDTATARAISLEVSSWIPQGFDAWFSRCVTRAINQRFKDAGEAYSALTSVLAVCARTSVPFAATQPLSQAPLVLSVAESTAPKPLPERTLPMTQPVSVYGAAQISSTPEIKPEPRANVSQPLGSSNPATVKIASALGAGALALMVAAFALKLSGNDGSGAASGPSSGATATPQAHSPALPLPALTPPMSGNHETVVRCPDGELRIPGGQITTARSRAIRLSPFCIDRNEATTDSFQRCVDAGACVPVTAHEPAGVFANVCNATLEGRDDHPINCIKGTQAKAYCVWRGARLPTNAEWEFAARGTQRLEFPWGDAEPTSQHTNACGLECPVREGIALEYFDTDPWPTTAPVGSAPYGASPFGVMDMVGNVSEWVSSDAAGSNGDAAWMRGSGWLDSPVRPSLAMRDRDPTRYIGRTIGVRCARSLGE